ncbi:MAG: PepSY domain-containing protein [Acidobacteria bacterium]|nr:PepSY domain-containing protein [Acidobacteriota bacterium]
MSFRKILFWIHLIVGCVVGLVVLMMSFTGVLLTYEQQIIDWAERGYHSAPPSPDAPRMPVAGLVAAASTGAEPPSTLTLEADPTAPVALGWGRAKTVYVNPYTGAALGEGDAGVRSFFRSVTSWHRWFAVEGEGREFWKGVTGASNLGFFFLVLSGMYLWLPKKWTPQSVRAIAWFRGGLSGKARDFNWHNVFGIWMAIPLALVVGTAAFFSYQWPSRLLYQALDGEAPPQRGGPPGRGGGPPGRGEGGPRAEGGGPRGERGERGGERGGPGGERRGRGPGGGEHAAEPVDPAVFAGLDDLLARVEQDNPGWRTIALSTPHSTAEPVGFTVSSGGRGRPDLRVELKLNRESGETVEKRGFAEQSAGRRWRTWVRWIHTGEVGGFWGQTIAGLASLAGVMLVWTGLMLSWRRFVAWRGRRARA